MKWSTFFAGRLVTLFVLGGSFIFNLFGCQFNIATNLLEKVPMLLRDLQHLNEKHNLSLADGMLVKIVVLDQVQLEMAFVLDTGRMLAAVVTYDCGTFTKVNLCSFNCGRPWLGIFQKIAAAVPCRR